MRRRPEEFRGRAQELLDRRHAEGDAALVQDIFSALARHLQVLSSPASIERFAAAADRITAAKRVFCLGLRSTFSVAYIFHYVRSLFGATSVLVDGGSFPEPRNPDRSSHDRQRRRAARRQRAAYSSQTVKAARYASDRRVKIVAVTDSEVSPLASIADELLLVGTETPSFFHSMTPAFAAVECLAALVAARQGSDTLKSLARSEAQLAAFDTYVLPRRRNSGR